MIADNDNGLNPCAAVVPFEARPQMQIYLLLGQPENFALLRRQLLPAAGLVQFMPVICPHPMPEAFGYRGSPQAAPSPHQSTTRRRRPAFIRGVHEAV